MNLADKSKAIAYADIVVLILGIVLVGIFSLVFAFEYDPDKKNSAEIRLHFVGLQIRFVIGGIIQLVSIYLILEGVLLRTHKPLTIWTLVTKVLLGLMIISGGVKLIMNPIFVILELLGCGYKVFCLKVGFWTEKNDGYGR